MGSPRRWLWSSYSASGKHRNLVDFLYPPFSMDRIVHLAHVTHLDHLTLGGGGGPLSAHLSTSPYSIF